MNLRRRCVLAMGWVPLAAPLASPAQPADRLRRIGVLSLNRAASDLAQYEGTALRAALRGAGYEEGKNLQVEWRYGEAEVGGQGHRTHDSANAASRRRGD